MTEPKPAIRKRIMNAFRNRDLTAQQVHATQLVRHRAEEFSHFLSGTVPEGRELNKALQLVEIAAGVARDGIERFEPASDHLKSNPLAHGDE